MRWRAGAVLAVIGIAAIPGVSDALEPAGVSSLRVSVKPASGSPTSRFVVGFKAAVTTGAIGTAINAYRVTATGPARSRCQASASSLAPSSHAGTIVHVTLAPGAHKRWCAGTFRGQVWRIFRVSCPPGKACPQIVVPPQMVGRFRFRVTPG